jgi:hypothetical protein
MTVVTLRPNAIGDKSQCTPVNDTPNYKCVDEESSDDDGTYVKSITEYNHEDLYNLLDDQIPVGSTINSVRVYALCRSENVTYPAYANTKIKTNGSEHNGTIHLPPTTYTLYDTLYTQNPITESAWTIEEINALQIGVVLASNYYLTYRNGRCTQVYVVVDYTEPSVEPPTVTTQDATGIGRD